MVAYRPQSRSTISRLTNSLAPAVQSLVKQQVGKMLYANAPSLKQLGRGARELYSGFSSKKQESTNNKSELIAAPAAMGFRRVSTSARTTRTSGGGTRIRHRELVNGAIAGSVAYSLQKAYALNPGNNLLFPWLSVQALQYQEYKIHSLSVDWVPIAPTSTQGDVILAVDYEASNPAPTTEVQAADLAGTNTFSCWRQSSLKLSNRNMFPAGPRKYIRNGNQYGDIKTYDCGNVFVCTENQISTSVIGKIYVSYDIEFFAPFNGPVSSNPAAISYHLLHAADQVMTSGAATNIIFDSNPWNALNITTPTSSTYLLPVGFYLITFTATVSDSTAETLLVQASLSVNGATINGFSTSVASAGGGVGPTSSVTISIVTPSDGNAVVRAQVFVTGAAGTIKALKDQTFMSIQST